VYLFLSRDVSTPAVPKCINNSLISSPINEVGFNSQLCMQTILQNQAVRKIWAMKIWYIFYFKLPGLPLKLNRLYVRDLGALSRIAAAQTSTSQQLTTVDVSNHECDSVINEKLEFTGSSKPINEASSHRLFKIIIISILLDHCSKWGRTVKVVSRLYPIFFLWYDYQVKLTKVQPLPLYWVYVYHCTFKNFRNELTLTKVTITYNITQLVWAELLLLL
jgi:hypothetical protein